MIETYFSQELNTVFHLVYASRVKQVGHSDVFATQSTFQYPVLQALQVDWLIFLCMLIDETSLRHALHKWCLTTFEPRSRWAITGTSLLTFVTSTCCLSFAVTWTSTKTKSLIREIWCEK